MIDFSKMFAARVVLERDCRDHLTDRGCWRRGHVHHNGLERYAIRAHRRTLISVAERYDIGGCE